VIADVLKTVAVLRIVEALVLDLPATLGHGIQATPADVAAAQIGEPIRLNDLAVRTMLTITDHAHGVPLQRLPRIEVIRVPELDAIGTVPEAEVRWLGAMVPSAKAVPYRLA
jgi:hypothetical protein